jgi:hypothetical protein
MPAYRISPMMGAIPKLETRVLPEGAAAEAANLFLTAKRLDVMSKPKNVAKYTHDEAQTIYRMFSGEESWWLSWKEQVDIAESPVYVENNFRIAFTSPEFEPRQTDLTLASVDAETDTYPHAWYVLGVTPPITKPTVTSVTGGAGPSVTRTYVYTFVTQWGEESAPSPAADNFVGNSTAGAEWNITIPDVAPSNTYTISDIVYSSGKLRLTLNTVFGLRDKETITVSDADDHINGSYRIDTIDRVNKYAYIVMPTPDAIVDTTGTATRNAPHNTTGMVKRVYRSVTTADGTDYYLVSGDIPVATTTFVDEAEVIGEPLETIGWAMPPADLEGICVHASGAMMGFVGNQVCISEPYSPYAWPLSYVTVLDFPIVGIGISGQSAIVGTEGKPYVLTFSDPISATPQKLDENWPCLAKEGIVAFNGGVYYPTTIGLAFVGSAGMRIVTKDLYAQRDWDKIKPRSFKAGFYDSAYYAIYDTGALPKILIISEEFGIVVVTVTAESIYTDRQTGELYVAYNKNISQLNSLSEGTLEYTWTSRTNLLPEPINLGVARLDFKANLSAESLSVILALNEAIEAANAAILATDAFEGTVAADDMMTYEVCGDSLQFSIDTSLANYCAFALIVDGVSVYQTVVEDTRMFRLPGGFKYDNFAIRLSGTAQVTSCAVATTAAALKTV